MKSSLKQILKRGIISLAPIGICLIIIVWIFNNLEKFFAPFLQKILGDKIYFTGLGFIFALIIIFFLSLIINTWIIKKIYALGEKIIIKIPFISSIYSSLKKMFSFFEKKNSFGKPVKVNLSDMSCIGFLTREDFHNIFIKKQVGKVCVFIPISYQIGGITIIVDSSKIEDIALTGDETFRFVFSGGILSKNGSD